MGLAYTRGLIIVPITSDEVELPFNIGHIRTIPYHRNKHGLVGLAKDLAQTIRSITSAG